MTDPASHRDLYPVPTTGPSARTSTPSAIER